MKPVRRLSMVGMVTGYVMAMLLSSCLFLQYPIATTFPIGGDATRNIASAEAVIEAFGNSLGEGFTALDRNSNYPAAILIVAASKLVPIPWPERWIWLMVAAHILTAAASGYVAWRLAGWRAGALALAAWGIAGMAYTWHVVDATLAQLLSLPLLLVVLWYWWQRRWLTGSLLLLLLYFVHPLSAITAIGTALWTMVISQPLRWPKRHHLPILAICLVLVIAVTYFFFGTVVSIMASFEAEEAGVSAHDLLENPIGPLVLLAPLGWLTLVRQQSPAAPWLLSLLLFSTLLFFSFRFVGASAFLVRWQSYFSLTVALLGAIGLDYILESLWPRRLVAPTLVASLLFGGLGLQTWQANTRTFAFFESPSRYERVHQTELEAIAWLDQHLPENSMIVSTQDNRHTEWIPILTRHRWVGLLHQDPLFTASGQELADYLTEHQYTHAIFLTKREKPRETMAAFDGFTVVFANEGVVVIDLANYESSDD